MANRMQMLARERPRRFQSQRVISIRWQLAPDEQFPRNGFSLSRTLNGVTLQILNEHRLPGARQSLDGTWSIVRSELQQDRLRRRAPFDGARKIVDVPDSQTCDDLLPILTFLLPEGSEDARAAQLEAIATAFGSSHEHDLELTFKYWNVRVVPSLTELLGMRTSTDPSELSLYEDVCRHYEAVARKELELLARDFGFAKFFGLGFDDLLADPSEPEGRPSYLLTADVVADSVGARFRGPADPYAQPPSAIATRREEALIGYPAFAPFYSRASTWHPPSPDDVPPLADNLRKVRAGPRQLPAGVARISWVGRSWSLDDREATMELLSFEAVCWRLERHRFLRDSAHRDECPPLSRRSFFRPCRGAECVLDLEENVWSDDPAPAWGAQPFEGWHAYQLRGIDVFGLMGCPSSPATIRFRDETPPPPPDIRTPQTTITLQAAAPTLLPVSLLWGAADEFAGPDAQEFRIAQRWIALSSQPLVVVQSAPAPGDLGAVQADVKLTSAAHHDVDDPQLLAWTRGTLITREGEFTVVQSESVAPSTLRVRRSRGRLPPLGDALMRYPEAPSHQEPWARTVVRREAAHTARIRLHQLQPLELSLSDPTNGNVTPPIPGRIYVSLLDATFEATPTATPGAFILAEPPSGDSAHVAVAILRGMTRSDAETFLNGSPALLLPAHEITLPLAPSRPFETGLLEVEVSSADGAPYQMHNGFVGNEGPVRKIRITAHQDAPPQRVVCPTPKHVWARAAAEFVEEAQATIAWPAADKAFRYEVERVLESALDLPTDATDSELWEAADRLGDACFERRSDHASSNRCSDALPGRAPTRALYRVRPVSATGVVGDWTNVATVRVPDIRIPSVPNFISIGPPHDREPRTLECLWTQAGPLEGVGYAIEARRPNEILHAAEGWAVVAEYLPGELALQPGSRYRASLENQLPGLIREFRIIAIRHALDPADPRARLLRQIRGIPSAFLRACADGEIRAPINLVATVRQDHLVELTWLNQDPYEHIEVRRRKPGGWGFERTRLLGNSQRYRETTPLPLQGEWTYEVRAIGSGRQCISECTTVLAP